MISRKSLPGARTWGVSLTARRWNCSSSWSRSVSKALIPDQLLLLEHAHVITLGRNGHMENLLASEEVLERAGISFYPTDRGGDVTYHGPGQLVGYPILDLREWKRDVGAYVRGVEQAIIDTLADFGIAGEPHSEADRRVGGGAQDRRHRRTHQPVGDVARLRAERFHRFELFPIHRSVRTDQARDLDGAAWRARQRGRSTREILAGHFGRIFDCEMLTPAVMQNAVLAAWKERSNK